MTDSSRRVYRALGRGFVAVGGGVALASVLDRALQWGFFRGSPAGTALFLVAIGVLLLWTVAQAERRGLITPDPAGDELDDEVAEELDHDDGHPERVG